MSKINRIKLLILWFGVCNTIDPEIIERTKCTPNDERTSLYPECMQGSNLILWCDHSKYTRIPDPDQIYLKKSCRNTLQLFINDSCIRKITEEQLTKYEEIEVLHCGWNRIQTLEGNAFRKNTKLREITLMRNYITRIEEDSFTGLHVLESLNLSSNLLKELKRSTFVGLENLQRLHLDNNVIKGLKNGTFLPLRHLRILDLSKNAIRTIEDGTFQGLGKLEALHLDENRLVMFEMTMLKYLCNLEELTLSYNNLQFFFLSSNISFKYLHMIDLSYNHVQFLSSSLLVRLPKLEVLKLKNYNGTSTTKTPVRKQSRLSYEMMKGLSHRVTIHAKCLITVIVCLVIAEIM